MWTFYFQQKNLFFLQMLSFLSQGESILPEYHLFKCLNSLSKHKQNSNLLSRAVPLHLRLLFESPSFWSQNNHMQSANCAMCVQQTELIQWLHGSVELSRASLRCWRLIVWHFNKIVVWISEVKRGDGPHSSTPLHWTVFYLDTARLQ